MTNIYASSGETWRGWTGLQRSGVIESVTSLGPASAVTVVKGAGNDRMEEAKANMVLFHSLILKVDYPLKF